MFCNYVNKRRLNIIVVDLRAKILLTKAQQNNSEKESFLFLAKIDYYLILRTLICIISLL